jgi:hypothetical protein
MMSNCVHQKRFFDDSKRIDKKKKTDCTKYSNTLTLSFMIHYGKTYLSTSHNRLIRPDTQQQQMGRIHSHHHHHHHHTMRMGTTGSSFRGTGAQARPATCAMIIVVLFSLLFGIAPVVLVGLASFPNTYETMWLQSGAGPDYGGGMRAPSSPAPSYTELMRLLYNTTTTVSTYGVFYADLRTCHVDTCVPSSGSTKTSSSTTTTSCTSFVKESWKDFVDLLCKKGYSRCSQWKSFRGAISPMPNLLVAALVFGAIGAVLSLAFIVTAFSVCCCAASDSINEYRRMAGLVRWLQLRRLFYFVAGLLAIAAIAVYADQADVDNLTPDPAHRPNSVLYGGVRNGGGFAMATAAGAIMLFMSVIVDTIVTCCIRSSLSSHKAAPAEVKQKNALMKFNNDPDYITRMYGITPHMSSQSQGAPSPSSSYA